MSESFSESEILEKIFPLINSSDAVLVPPGDDCAVFSCGGKSLAVTVDQVIRKKHYLSQTTPYEIGRKLMARNLSDIAAMGGNPQFAVLASATHSKNSDWLLDFHRGVVEEGAKYGVILIGGDLATSPADDISSLTLIGEVENKGILRSGAQPGDKIFCTGRLGNSFESGHHLSFTPRIQEGQWLKKYASAMIDITDGLLIDLKRICLQSKCSAILNLASLPLSEKAAVQQAMTDGEDYELLFAVKEEFAETVQNEWPFSTPLTMIGHFSSDLPVQVLSESGDDLLSIYGEGFDHFK